MIASGVWEPGKEVSSETEAQLQWRHLTGYGTLLHTMLLLPFLYKVLAYLSFAGLLARGKLIKKEI